jgi:transposase-like protein
MLGRLVGGEGETPMERERAYSQEFKAKVILEFIRERKSANQIYADYGIPEDLLNGWIQEFLEVAYLAFVVGKSEDQKSKRIEELEKLVSQLSRDLDASSRALKFMSRAFSVRKVVKSDGDVAESSHS